MTPSEYNNKTPSEHTNETSIEHKKATPLEVAHLDVYEYKDIPKLDEAYLRLLRPKRLSRIRYARYKVQIGGYDLIYLPLEDAQIYKHILTLDTNEKAQAQQTGLVVVDKLSKDRPIEDYIDVLEEALRPKDSGTIYAHCIEYIQLADERYSPFSKTLDALEEARGLDHEVKRHGLKHGVYSKTLHGLSQIHGPCSSE